jgi:hypothetical protein
LSVDILSLTEIVEDEFLAELCQSRSKISIDCRLVTLRSLMLIDIWKHVMIELMNLIILKGLQELSDGDVASLVVIQHPEHIHVAVPDGINKG